MKETRLVCRRLLMKPQLERETVNTPTSEGQSIDGICKCLQKHIPRLSYPFSNILYNLLCTDFGKGMFTCCTRSRLCKRIPPLLIAEMHGASTLLAASTHVQTCAQMRSYICTDTPPAHSVTTMHASVCLWVDVARTRTRSSFLW